MAQTIGEFIKKVRKSKKMTLVELENLSGVSNSYLSQIENNKFKPTPEILKKIASGLDLSYNKLLESAGYLQNSENLDFLKSSILSVYLKTISQLEGKKITKISNANLTDFYAGEDAHLFLNKQNDINAVWVFQHHFAKIAELGEFISLILRAHEKFEDAIEALGLTKEEFIIFLMVQKFEDYDENKLKIISDIFGKDIVQESIRLREIVRNEWKQEVEEIRSNTDLIELIIYVPSNVQLSENEWVELNDEEAFNSLYDLEKLLYMIQGLKINDKEMSLDDKKKAIQILKLVFS